MDSKKGVDRKAHTERYERMVQEARKFHAAKLEKEEEERKTRRQQKRELRKRKAESESASSPVDESSTSTPAINNPPKQKEVNKDSAAPMGPTSTKMSPPPPPSPPVLSSSPSKREKKNPDSEENLLECTCAVSRSCALASKKGVIDCRLGFAPIPRRVTAKNKTAYESTHYISTKDRAKIQRTVRDFTDFLTVFRRVTAAKSESERATFLRSLRDQLQKLMLFSFPPGAETTSQFARMLDDDNGLPAMINNPALPFDVKLDVEMIYLRWNIGDFDDDLIRGIDVRQGTKAGKAANTSRSLDHTSKFKRPSDFVGEGHLRNGQWFPYQLCALRDGAHGESEAGISGKAGVGAFSIILSSSGRKNTYADVDEGDVISYCGTRGKETNPSHGTKLLLESAKKQNPIRVLRSSKLAKVNQYKPVEGLRYDGLYVIHDKELLDENTAMHRFQLHRVPGQTPIRYTGPEMRPNQREVDAFKQAKSLSKGSTLM